MISRIFQKLPVLDTKDITRRANLGIDNDCKAFPRGESQSISISARTLTQLGNFKAQTPKRISGFCLKNCTDRMFAKFKRRSVAVRENVEILQGGRQEWVKRRLGTNRYGAGSGRCFRGNRCWNSARPPSKRFSTEAINLSFGNSTRLLKEDLTRRLTAVLCSASSKKIDYFFAAGVGGYLVEAQIAILVSITS